MPYQLTKADLRAIFPKAPEDVISNSTEWQKQFDQAGITHTRTRLAYCLANVEHECGGFTIPNLTENINYSAIRMAQVWPNRFPSATSVMAKYGSAPGWQKKAFDDIYGNRMGNRPGTSDGSRYIGRGGPQVTGRDGYHNVGVRSGLPLEDNPEQAAMYANQPAIIAAFWSWKKLNARADAGDFKGCVKLWNGGTNGMADRQSRMAGNDPIIARLKNADKMVPTIDNLPGAPPTKEAPPDVVKEATKEQEQRAKTTGKAGGVAGGAAAGDATIKTTTGKPDGGLVPILTPVVEWAIAGICIGVIVIVVIELMHARKRVKAAWAGGVQL